MRMVQAVLVILVGGLLGYFVYNTTVNPDSSYPFKLGLDLAGGSHLVYEADVSGTDPEEVPELMNVLKDVIERRINIFGVSEPIIQVETSSVVSGADSHRLVVELPGVTNVSDAVAEIGRTPLLEFKLVEPAGEEVAFVDTGLTGRYLERASLQFGQGNGGGLSNEPVVSIDFTADGGQLFESITGAHVGEQLAIFLDGEMMSSPVIREAIAGGSAVISGDFTPTEARDLVQNLNFGALPLPIALVSTQTIDASLGADLLSHGVSAGVIGVALVLAFMLLWYRLPGIVAGVALLFYGALMLSLFKLVPVTLTAAGLAGFILSIGMAVDANVLVFERIKEEFRSGKKSREAAQSGFSRAWSAIRDGNMTSLLSAIILFWFGTSLVKGFALVFGFGVLASMLTALVVTRTLLLVLPDVAKGEGFVARLFGSGTKA
ncbi:protein translocase subunit SecD [Candidatus Kaiserbacteria bacterium]|nr:protein translocase subunit SecD [Candidatus Kaiserbacteria bacterium]